MPQSDKSDCDYFDVLFDGPPSHESGSFVEVESPAGTSVRYGEWIDRGDGYWALRFPKGTTPAAVAEAVRAESVRKGAESSFHCEAWGRRVWKCESQCDKCFRAQHESAPSAERAQEPVAWQPTAVELAEAQVMQDAAKRIRAIMTTEIGEMENAVQDTEASGRPAAHLYGAWQNLKHAIIAPSSARPTSPFSVLDRPAIVTLVESYFHRVRKLGGDTGECDAYGIADWLMWDGKVFLPKVGVESATRLSEIPAELFDGMAVYVSLGEKSGVSPRDVAAVLDAVVRLIRANRG